MNFKHFTDAVDLIPLMPVYEVSIVLAVIVESLVVVDHTILITGVEILKVL